MPSSLVTSTRALRRLSGFLAIGADRLQPAAVGPRRLRHGDAAVGLLVVLHDGDEAAADRPAGAVQGVHEAGAFSSEDGREGKGCGSTCRYGERPDRSKKT